MLRLCFALVLFAGCGNETPPPQTVSAVSSSSPLPATELREPTQPTQPGTVTECPKCTECPACPCAATDLAALRSQLDTANAKIAELSATPAAVFAALLPQLDTEDSVSLADADRMLGEIATFQARFPDSPEAKRVKAYTKLWTDTKKTLVKMESDNRAAEAARAITGEIGTVEDGSDMAADAAIRLAGYLERASIGVAEIKKLPQASYDEAMKDPDSERGKGLNFTGTIVQIRKDGDYFTGQMCSGYCSKVIYFVTPGTTTGLVEDKRAAFTGIVTQRYTYENAMGGSTHSLLLVGFFQGQ